MRSSTGRRPSGVVLATLLAGTIAAVPFLGEELLPNFREYDFLMHWVEKPGASVEASRASPSAPATS